MALAAIMAVQQEIGARAAEDYIGCPTGDGDTQLGPLEVNYFSFTFPLSVRNGSDRHEFYVKIPKDDLRGRDPSILPLSQQDIDLGIEEAKSLGFLTENWDGTEERVQWIEFVGYCREYNALITRRVVADDACEVFRRQDIRRRFGFSQDADRLRDAMERLGSALGRFHAQHAKPTRFSGASILPKLESYCYCLSKQTRSSVVKMVKEHKNGLCSFTAETLETTTLKGIDIRNVLTRDGSLFLLDPGKLKRTYREADLARFLLTYRVLHWGSKVFLLVGEPDRQAEEAFLRGYGKTCSEVDEHLLGLYILKEQMKHWDTALDSVARRDWPWPVKSLLTRVYVNPFFERQILKQLRKMGSLGASSSR
jgi:hypothetical protein